MNYPTLASYLQKADLCTMGMKRMSIDLSRSVWCERIARLFPQSNIISTGMHPRLYERRRICVIR